MAVKADFYLQEEHMVMLDEIGLALSEAGVRDVVDRNGKVKKSVVIQILAEERYKELVLARRPSTEPEFTEKILSPIELMRLPAEERQKVVEASIKAAADEDFEIFEAYSEE